MSSRNPANYLCLGAVFLLSQGVASEAEDAIAECARVASTGDRILCLENALRELSPASADNEAPFVEPASSMPIEDNSLPAVAASDSEAGSTEEREIGAQQLEARQRRNMTREEVLAELETVENLAVAAYREVPYKRLVVELENGQVWRQINGDTQEIRVSLNRNQTVNIAESSLGGYQLRLNEIRRTIRVERIK